MHLSTICLLMANLLCLFRTSSSLTCNECRTKEDCKKKPLRDEVCTDGATYYDSDGNAKQAICGTRSSGGDLFEAGCGPDKGWKDKECNGEDCDANNKNCQVTRCTCKTNKCNDKDIVKTKDKGGDGGDSSKASGPLQMGILHKMGCIIVVLLTYQSTLVINWP